MQIEDCKLCPKEDASLAASISSLLSQNENQSIMSVQTQQPTFIRRETNQTVQEVPNTQQVSQVEQSKQDNQDIESLKKALEAAELKAKEKEDIVTKLVNKDKTNTLNSLFETVKDVDIKDTLVKKYISADTDLLNGYTADYVKYVLPSKIEEAKAQAESELKNKLVEENKGKSKAGSLPAEPVKEESKAGSIVPKSVNEIKLLDRLMKGVI